MEGIGTARREPPQQEEPRHGDGTARWTEAWVLTVIATVAALELGLLTWVVLS